MRFHWLVLGLLAVVLALGSSGCGSGGGQARLPDMQSANAPSSEESAGTFLLRFVTKDGQELEVEAIPGKLVAILEEQTAIPGLPAGAAVESQHGALLLLSVVPGTESSSLAQLNGSAQVRGAWPVLPARSDDQGCGCGCSTHEVAAARRELFRVRSVDVRVVDDSHEPVCETNHAQAVAALAGVNEFREVRAPGHPDRPASSDLLRALSDAAFRSVGSSELRVINMSQSGGTASPLAPQRATADMVVWLSSLMDALSKMDLTNTVVVLSAGNGLFNSNNGGLDIGGILAALFGRYPELAGHVVFVGSSGRPGECLEFTGYNHARRTEDANGNPFFAYAPGNEVPLPGFPNCRMSGTSAAAPQVARALADALGDSSDPLADVVKAFLKARKHFNCPRIAAHSGRVRFTRRVDYSGAQFGRQGFEQVVVTLQYSIAPEGDGSRGQITYQGAPQLEVTGSYEDLAVGGNSFRYFTELSTAGGTHSLTDTLGSATLLGVQGGAYGLDVTMGGVVHNAIHYHSYFVDRQTGIRFNETNVQGNTSVGFLNRNGGVRLAPSLDLTAAMIMRAQSRSYSTTSPQTPGDPSYGTRTLTHTLEVL